MKELTAVMISFMRTEYTKECVRSLKEVYPEINIIVGDNDHYNKDLHDFIKKHGGHYFVMPFDSGVCVARNRLMEFVDTEFVMVGDDDFYYTKEANVDGMLNFLRSRKEFSLVGGRVSEGGRTKNYQGHIDIFPDHFEYRNLEPELNRYDEASEMTYQKVDITFNYFVARTEDIRDIKWDEGIKVAFEHSDWFISVKKARKNVAYTPNAIVIHKPEHVKCERKVDYSAYRNRRSDEHRFFEKHGIKYSIGFRGVKYRPRGQKKSIAGVAIPQAYYAKRRLNYDGKIYNAGDIIHTTTPTDDMNPCF